MKKQGCLTIRPVSSSKGIHTSLWQQIPGNNLFVADKNVANFSFRNRSPKRIGATNLAPSARLTLMLLQKQALSRRFCHVAAANSYLQMGQQQPYKPLFASKLIMPPYRIEEKYYQIREKHYRTRDFQYIRL